MERKQLVATVTAAQNGDSEALNLLFNTYYNDVYYFALKTLKDADLACDITQEAFVEIINTIGDLKAPEAFVTWMRQVTYHQCTRYFKKKKEVLVEEDDEGNSVFDTIEEEREEFIPGEGVDKEDFRATILALLDTLSEEQRAAVLMHYYHEMSVKEIAEAQKVSEGTVKSRLNYARKSLKKSVEDYEKKHDVKLHCAGVLPLLLWLFANASKEAMPIAAAETVAADVTTATGTTISVTAGGSAVVAATTVAAGTGLIAKIAALPVITKVVAGIVAAALVMGGIGAAVGIGLEVGAGKDKTLSGDEQTDTTPYSDAMTQPTTLECTHEWVVANCTAPKTCGLCGATEGGLLDHTWIDANYQSPKHCSGCDITEGEPLVPDFEQYGLNVMAPEIGVEYDYVTTCADDTSRKTTGKLYFTRYWSFDGDLGFPAEEGYVWHALSVEMYFEDSNAINYGARIAFSHDDFYDIMGWDASSYVNEDGMLCTATTFNGVVFDQCRINIKNSWTRQPDDTQLCESTIYWRVPAGFDGYVLSFRDSGVAWEDGQHIYDIADENTLLFRLGATPPERSVTEATDAQLKRCIGAEFWGGGTENDAWDKEAGETCSVKLSYTHAVEELELAAYHIVGAEVLSATLNGVPCTIYQTHDPDKIVQITASEGPGDYEDYIDRLHTVFLVESPEITARVGEYGEIVADYYYTVRVYLSDGSYRDLEYGRDDYYLLSGFGGMITYPETYE